MSVGVSEGSPAGIALPADWQAARQSSPAIRKKEEKGLRLKTWCAALSQVRRTFGIKCAALGKVQRIEGRTKAIFKAANPPGIQKEA